MSTILVVDDLAIFREPLAAALSYKGYQTLEACDGVEALSRVAEASPDLILMDVTMPGLNGVEVVRRLRSDKRTQDIPVIFLTACTERRFVIEAAKLGVRDYLLKSTFSLENLLSRIREGLTKKISPAAPAPKTPPAPADLSPAAPAFAASDSSNSPATALEALKSLKPIITRTQIAEKVEALGEICAMSPCVSQILKLTNNPNTSLDDIIRLVRQDQAIALKILKLANSVVYTRGEPVESVRKAVMRIGLAQIRQAVMNISVIERFQIGDLDGHLTISDFWEHSIACGLIAAEITHLAGGSAEDADRAFTMGLLHDVGRMIYAEQLTDLYRTVLETADRLQLPLEQVESRMLLVNHADLMDRVLHLWRFPKELITPIALHHLSIGNIRHLAPNMVGQIALLSLANALAHALILGSSGNLAIYPTHDLARSLRLDAGVIQRIVDVIPEQTQEIKLVMMANANQGQWETISDRIRKQIGVPLSPLVASGDPGIDAFAVLAKRLCPPAGPEPSAAGQPFNLGIVHIAHPSERILVTSRLKAAEAEAGTGPLPLVILSPSGALTLEDSAMAGRKFELLPYPLALSRLIGSIKRLLAP